MIPSASPNRVKLAIQIPMHPKVAKMANTASPPAVTFLIRDPSPSH